MSWIESHDTLARHPKTRRLVRLLNISTPQAIGHLHLLWWWALEYAEQGNLQAYDEADIADAAMWEGEAAIFVGALRQAGFIDADDTIHDWQDYAGKLLAQRKANAERQAAFRNGRKAPQSIPLQSPNPPSTNNHADVTPRDMTHNTPVTVTSASRNVLTVTVPTTTTGIETIPPTPQPGPKPAIAPTALVVDNFTPWFEAFWTAYPMRRGKRLNKPKALTKAKQIPSRDWDSVLQAARNYADSDQGRRGFVEDAHRFLAHWEDWQEPEIPDAAQNGATHDHPQYTTAHDRNAASYANWAAALAEQAPPDPNPRLDRPDLRLIG